MLDKKVIMKIFFSSILVASAAIYFIIPGDVPNHYNKVLFAIGNARWIIKYAFPHIEAFMLENKRYVRVIFGPILLFLLFMDIGKDGVTGFTGLAIAAIMYWCDILCINRLGHAMEDNSVKNAR